MEYLPKKASCLESAFGFTVSILALVNLFVFNSPCKISQRLLFAVLIN